MPRTNSTNYPDNTKAPENRNEDLENGFEAELPTHESVNNLVD